MDEVERLTTLLGSPDIYTQKNAIDALAILHDQRAMEALVKALRNDNVEIRLTALRAIKYKLDVSTVPDLLEAIKNAQPSHNQFITRNYCRDNADDGQEANCCENSAEMRQARLKSLIIFEAWWTLFEIGEPAVKYIIRELDSSDPVFDYFGELMLMLLWKIGNGEALDAIERLMQHKDRYVRGKLVKLIGGTDDSGTIHYLLKALRDKDWGVRWTAVNALGGKKDQRAINAILTAMKDENAIVREIASKVISSERTN